MLLQQLTRAPAPLSPAYKMLKPGHAAWSPGLPAFVPAHEPARQEVSHVTTAANKSTSAAQPGVQDAKGDAVLWVSQVTPHGVLVFLPSYQLMNRLARRWQETGIWRKLEQQKNVFMESRNVRDHNDTMEDFYKYVETDRGAILFAVFRGKVSEGMDFKDHQARAVITIGIPYPNTFDMAVKEKMAYNDKYEKSRGLLRSSEWLRVQAYRALNQAVGRCVRHRGDWGAVLMIDARFQNPYYTEHLSKWLRGFLNNNHHTFESLVNSPNSLESFMQSMTINETEDV
ncbi:Fanconi anemia group J protein-like [Ostrinia furnacalis]|uniref:Fanconi anemia group J protein-like n=1 Tax=Ostrinia furnacalis TaxID=93504 RepID=UPI00103CBCD8|nr:Fanconi anemia group J protein-like [Ostrinia furnacalis]